MTTTIPPAPDPAWSGGRATSFALCVLAPNPSPMTLDGTNTWILHDERFAAIVDPGPDDPVHRARIIEELHAGDWTPTAVLLTHRHLDHAAGASSIAQRLGVPIVPPNVAAGADAASGIVQTVGSLEVRLIATPGHTADSVCMLVEHGQALLTGDTVLGRGTSVIAPDGGDLAAYLASLDRLQDLAGDLAVLLPGHGPALGNPVDVLAAYVDHRRRRLDEVRVALMAGARSIGDVRDTVYGPLSQELEHAATWSVRAQVRYLVSTGAVEQMAFDDLDAP